MSIFQGGALVKKLGYIRLIFQVVVWWGFEEVGREGKVKKWVSGKDGKMLKF